MMAGFVFFMIRFWHFHNPNQIALFCVVPVLGIVINYIVLRPNLTTLQALAVTAMRADPGPSNSIPPSAGTPEKPGAVIEPSAQEQALLRTSRPREIRMAKHGQLNLALTLLVVLLFTVMIGLHLYAVWARTLSIAIFGSKDWAMTGLTALLLLIPLGVWRSQVRECDLLENGDIVLGKIVRQWNNDQSTSSIEYEYKDYQGETHKALGVDYTKKLFEGMSVAVFYDRDNPKRQIPSCATFHEVVI